MRAKRQSFEGRCNNDPSTYGDKGQGRRHGGGRSEENAQLRKRAWHCYRDALSHKGVGCRVLIIFCQKNRALESQTGQMGRTQGETHRTYEKLVTAAL